MPLPRAALYGQGEDLHVSVWPGGIHNTEDISRFMAKEGRSYVVAVSGFMHADDLPKDFPFAEEMLAHEEKFWANGGSCVVAPDGSFVIEPVMHEEALLIADIDHAMVRRERQNFDAVGHYSRPDVTELYVNRKRLSTVRFEE